MGREEKRDKYGIGVWRSWLARTLREREGAGSSPATPTSINPMFSILYERFIVEIVER